MFPFLIFFWGFAMKIVTPAFYRDFKCIAGDCPDSCCQGWEVDADSDSLKYYESLTGGFKNRIDSVLSSDEYGNTVFRLTSNKRCPFLNDDNLCDMHIALGQEHTPYTCRTFPRFINDFGSLREIGLSFSCPVAADMMFGLKDGFAFSQEINSDLPVLNDIDAGLYYRLLTARNDIYNLLDSSSTPLNEKLSELLDFCVRLQREIGEMPNESEAVTVYEVLDNPERINPQYGEKLENADFSAPLLNNAFSQTVAKYLVFRYFLNAVYDCDVLSRAKLAVLGAFLPSWLGNDAWSVHLWSKETEHSDLNMERLWHNLKYAECLSVDSLKEMLKK